MAELEIVVPATLANLGSGYDTLGAAIHLVNRFTVAAGARMDPGLVGATARRAGVRFGTPAPPFQVSQVECVPRSRGLGSSATARVAGLLAWKSLTGQEVSRADTLAFLAEEDGHPDNVWPALLGGLVICGREARQVIPHAGIAVAIASPDREVSTDEARRALPASVSHTAAVHNVRAVSALLVGLLHGDAEALADGVRDALHQPFRASMLGPVEEAFAAARALQAAPFVSGSGSTLAAFVLDGSAEDVAEALAAPYRAQGIEVVTRVSHLRAEGAAVLS